MQNISFHIFFFQIIINFLFTPSNQFIQVEWQVSRILFKDGHSSGPAVARWLKQPTRALRGRKPISPAWLCSRRGLPCSACYQADGEPLPHHFTLIRQKHGGRYSFCGTFQSLRTAPVRSRLSCWSPDFPSAIKHGGRPSRHSMYINYSFKKILSTAFYFSILIFLDLFDNFCAKFCFQEEGNNEDEEEERYSDAILSASLFFSLGIYVISTFS